MITDVDAALAEIRNLAAWLAVTAHDPHSPEQCACGGGLPWGPGHVGLCDRLTRAQKQERLAGLIRDLDLHLSAGGALPTDWAHDATAPRGERPPWHETVTLREGSGL